MKITNSLTGKKEMFAPLKKGKVKMYVCGITPYDLSHIGHARTYVAFDMIRRYLERNYKVEFVVNVTDVDDKIIKRANEKGVSSDKFAEEMADLFWEDMDALKVRYPDHVPKVTETMKEIVEFIKGLIKKKYAYVLNGDVYFDVTKFKGYGKLSGNIEDALKEGARIEPNPSKKNPGDFALWKAAKPGEPSWKSPWSDGRPGWHIECSAMNLKILGKQIDIHGGGMDLKFPHHENEIAQTESYTGKKFAKYWMHTGFLTVNGEKMSKSLGNFITIRDMLKKISPEALRLFLLRTHYRSPIDFSDKALNDAKEAQRRLQDTYDRLHSIEAPKGPSSKEVDSMVKSFYKSFESSMDNDFSATEALAALFSFTRDVNRIIDSGKYTHHDIVKILDVFEEADSIFDILSPCVEEFAPREVLDLVEKRESFRKQKKFKEADAARDKIRSFGYEVEDSPQGPIVKKA